MQVPACMVGVEVKKGMHHPVKKRTSEERSRICCFCMCGEKAGSPDDPTGMLARERRRKFISGCTNSFAVCAGLIGYTFLGAILFVAIEGGGIFTSIEPPRSKAPTATQNKPASHEWPANFGDNLRNRAVENIWEITVNLNILYRENWTRLAALEIARFQEQLASELARELEDESADGDEPASTQWDLASGLLYSITILTTTGYGKMGPKTVLGKTATMAYAAVGIPLMLVYLSSIGQLLSSCAIALFRRPLSRARAHTTTPPPPRLEPFYIRAPGDGERNLHCSETLHKSPSISVSSHFNSAPTHVVHASGKGTVSTVLCFGVMIAYICCGAVILCLLEKNWSYLDGVFFCFMTLSTINFVDARGGPHNRNADPTTVWFFSLYILSGMALTAMCFNIFHREVVYRLDACQQRTLPS